MCVDVKRGATFEVGAAKPLFDLPPGFAPGADYVVTRDERFLFAVPHDPATQSMTVILNWTGALTNR